MGSRTVPGSGSAPRADRAQEIPKTHGSGDKGEPPNTVSGTGQDRQNLAAMALLQLQAEMRKAQSLTELGYFIANETRTLLRAQQIVVFDRVHGKHLAVHTVSSLTSIERSSPLVLWFESIAKRLASSGELGKIREFDGSAFAADFEAVQRAYPLQQMLWVPWIARDGSVRSGMLMMRASPWGEHEVKIAGYLAEAFAHAWASLRRPVGASLVPHFMTQRTLAVAAAVVAALLCIPVPMTALAPVEVGPRETSVVTPGVEGIIRSVEVEPNAVVTAGQLLVTLNDTILRNRAAIAEREVLIADTKYKKAAQLAFVDVRGRHEMAIAKSELDLKLAERDYAHQLLQRTEIRADRGGVAFFADKKDLVGKPVAVGEKLMEVADPASREFRIELPAADAIVLHDGARVKVFLDSDPLNPVEAKLVRAAYKAAPREAQQFAFRLVAESATQDAVRLRLGMRGTAQIYSDNVALGFYLFRRPIAAARQWLGL